MQQNLYASILIVLIALTVCGTLHSHAQTRKAVVPADPTNPLKELIEGEQFVPPSIQAQQADDFDNPAYVYVELGERLFSTPEGSSNKSCTSCHQGDKNKLSVASYPKYMPDTKRVITLSERINLCREKNVGASPYNPTGDNALAMIAYLRHKSRGAASSVDVRGAPAADIFLKGKRLFESKIGKLQLSCAQCHNQNYGQKFGSEILSQGHPQAYPVFKVTDNQLISLHERFRKCNEYARAEPQPENAQDYIALELYLSWRSKNLPITAPGVRP